MGADVSGLETSGLQAIMGKEFSDASSAVVFLEATLELIKREGTPSSSGRHKWIYVGRSRSIALVHLARKLDAPDMARALRQYIGSKREVHFTDKLVEETLLPGFRQKVKLPGIYTARNGIRFWK